MQQLIDHKQHLWLMIMAFAFLLAPIVLQAQSNITRVEYYIDTDPGFGNGTNVSIGSSADIFNLVIPINPTSVMPGVHHFYVRAKDANGSWSLTNSWLFYKSYTQPAGGAVQAIPKLKKLEYYIDADPGLGSGIPVALDSLTDFNNYVVPINVTGLVTGNHTFWIRGVDNNGNWSLVNSWPFNVPSALASPSIVVNSITQTLRCARDSFDISYDATGTYNSGNVFNAELSDASGNFGSPVTVGSFSGTGNSIVKVKLPSHLTEGSYKIRVSSTNPVVTGVINALAIAIHDRPNAQTITGVGDANISTLYNFNVPSVTGSTWQWIAPGATINSSNNAAGITWAIDEQPRGIKVVETNQYGCMGDTSLLSVNVYTPVINNVASSSLTPCPLGTLTVTGNATGVYDGVNKFTAQLSDASGSFASPVNIGTVTAGSVGMNKPVSISATLPYPLTNGSGYRVRIVSNSPSITSIVDNGQNIEIDKPNLGTDQAVSKCPGFTTDISTVFTTTGLTTEWSTATPATVDVGTYQLIVSNGNGCKDTASVTVSNFAKPNLGLDKSTTISCANGTADLTTVYNLSGLIATYSTSPANAAPVGNYTIIVANNDGCKDTANINVLDASTVPVPSSGANLKTASRECTDGNGWTHYYDDNGTPTDYSDDIRLLSIMKNGNNIGTIGDGTFHVTVAATTGAGSNKSIGVVNSLVTVGNEFFSMNRYWNVTPTTQPTSPVGVRYYYNTQDLNDVNGDASGAPYDHVQLLMYKLQGGNPDPTANWAGATGVTYLTSSGTASLTNWVYSDLGNNRNQAEFLVNSFSGGGAGVIGATPLPVTLISFTATAQNDRVALQWSTASEINSKSFTIQRSSDGLNFENIGTVGAAGNSTTQRDYRYEDLQTLSGIIFYRIVETDIDGHSFYSNVKRVNIYDAKNSFTLRYNPVKDEAVVRYECAVNDKVLIVVIDHLGRIIMKQKAVVVKGVNDIKIETTHLAQGIYEIELTSNSKGKYHVRMMKE